MPKRRVACASAAAYASASGGSARCRAQSFQSMRLWRLRSLISLTSGMRTNEHASESDHRCLGTGHAMSACRSLGFFTRQVSCPPKTQWVCLASERTFPAHAASIASIATPASHAICTRMGGLPSKSTPRICELSNQLDGGSRKAHTRAGTNASVHKRSFGGQVAWRYGQKDSARAAAHRAR